MCQKLLQTWTCGCTHLCDPHLCSKALLRHKPCESYPYIWAFRAPNAQHLSTQCAACERLTTEAQRQQANAAYIANSAAYPVLKGVEDRDDEERTRRGWRRFQREEGEDAAPPGWTAECNRLPQNANEFEAFLTGRFDPRRRLPDTHVPVPVSGGQIERAEDRELRLRLPPPPMEWQGTVILEEDEYPVVQFRRPEMGVGAVRRPSYTGNRGKRGWAPPATGALPPRQAKDIEPPSCSTSPNESR